MTSTSTPVAPSVIGADVFANLTSDQIRAILASKVDIEASMRQAQTTVLLTEEGGATFLQGIVDRASVETSARSVKKSWTGINFTAEDGTDYRAYVVLTDVKATAALPPVPKAAKS